VRRRHLSAGLFTAGVEIGQNWNLKICENQLDSVEF